MSRHAVLARLVGVGLGFLGLAFLVLALVFSQAVPGPIERLYESRSAHDRLEQAWRLVQRSGAYRFASQIDQTTLPAPTVSNVGVAAETQHAYFQGSADLRRNHLELTFWQNGGSPAIPNSGVQVRVEGGRAYGRVPGGTWQQLDDPQVSFAPDNDPTIFLATTRNVRELGVETRNVPIAGTNEQRTLTFTRYSFDIDRPALAELMRERLEQRLREAGELPAGLNLGSADLFRTLGGSGEVWIDADGFPARISTDLEFPEQAGGERITATIVTDLHDYDRSVLTPPALLDSPIAWAGHVSGLAFLGAAGRSDLFMSLGAIMLVLAAAITLITFARSRRLYRVVAVTAMVTIVFGPLFQAQQAHAFNEAQAERIAERNAAAAADAHNQALQAELFASNWDPHTAPAAQVAANATAPVAPEEPPLDPDRDEDGDGISNAEEERIGTNPLNADSDEDDITDNAEIAGFTATPAVPPTGEPEAPPLTSEERIGHLEALGQLWYSNPNSADSDGDGMLDALECPERIRPEGALSNPAGVCRDTDGDGVPDIFDLDHDNDGLINRVDLSPDRWLGSANTNLKQALDRAAPFTSAAPLGLSVNSLAGNKPVFVDLQLRPRDPKHLTYALNVLDWPTNDTQGQIQRTRTTTFEGTGGDLQLVPMLEVTIPYEAGRFGNLPIKPGVNTAVLTPTAPLENWLDTDRLDEYRISPSLLNNGDIALYAPLTLIEDDTGANRVGFTARLLYQPRSPLWGQAQNMRMVWAVLMLTDACNGEKMPADIRSNSDPKAAEAWCNNPANRVENTSIVHRYFDDWYLTGMSIQEEHSADTAILYEDPAKDAAETPDSLMLLTEQLSKTFIAGRDCDTLRPDGSCQGDGKRDITVAAMPDRFDHTRNATLNPPERALGLRERDDDGGTSLNVVRIDRKAYSSQSEALVDMAANRVGAILDANFAGAQAANPPLLMFAMEAHYRTLNLSDTRQAAYAGGVLTMNAAQTEVLVEASLNWKAYKRVNNAWTILPPAEYFDLLSVQYKRIFKELEPQEEDAVINGQALVASSYHLAMYQGLSGFPQIGSRIVIDPLQADDVQLARKIGTGIVKSGKLVKKVVRYFVDREADDSQLEFFEKYKLKAKESYANFRETIDDTAKRLSNARRELYRNLGSVDDVADAGKLRTTFTKIQRLPSSLKAAYKTYKLSLPKTPKLKHAQRGALVGAVVATAVIYANTSGDTVKKTEAALAGVGLIFAIKSAYEAYEIFKGVQTFTRGMKIAAVVGLVIEVGVAVGLLLYTVISAGLAIGGLVFNQLLADTIGTIVVAILLFALLAIPLFGQLIVALVALIDAVIAVVCKLFDLEERGAVLRDWVCKGISGSVAKIISKVIYGQTDIVVMTPGSDAGYERLAISGARPPTLRTPSLGLVAGQELTFGHSLTNTLRLTSRSAAERNDPKTIPYYDLIFTADVLRSSTFAYDMQSRENDIHGDLDRGDQRDEWQAQGDDYRIRREVKETFRLDNAGVNQPLGGTARIFLSEGFAYPVAECFIIPIVPWDVCKVRTSDRTDHIPVGSNLYYDVFPATLSAFYTPAEVGGINSGSFTLKWGLNGNPAFGPQRDFDGDGLLSRKNGGNDPDDSRFDTDGDGLPDSLEISRQTRSDRVDTDEDGLSDRYEIIAGTNPLRADTDGDGLSDAAELSGWRFVYALDAGGAERFTLVTSDPKLIDADGDELTDFQEFTLGTNPRVPTDPTVLDFNLSLRERDVAVALLSFDEPGGTTVYGNRSFNGSLANAICAGDTCPVGGLTGYSGNGVRFDGPAQALALPTLDLSGELTLAAWINPESTAGDQPIIAHGDGRTSGVFLRLRDGFYEFGAVNGGMARAAATADGWSHLAGSYDGATWRLFRNGVAIADAPGSGPLRDLSGWAIGGYAASESAFFHGAVDEAAIFGNGLDAAQVGATQARRYNLNDGIVRPGDTLLLAGSARNRLLGRYLQGVLRAEDPTDLLDTTSIPQQPLVLQPNQPIDLSGELQIPSTATTAETTLNLVADGQVVNVNLRSGDAQLWLPFDTSVANGDSTSFPNQSGDLSVPPALCQGSTCPTLDDTGRNGGAVRFDGSDDLLTVARGASEGPYSIAFWLQTTQADGGIFAVSRTTSPSGARDRRVYLNGGRLCASVNEEYLCTDERYNDGAWHHVVHVFGGAVGAQRIFVDGEAQAIGTASASGYKDDAVLLIGRVGVLPAFQGLLDDLRVYAKALPPDEIINLAEKAPVYANAFDGQGGIGFDAGGDAFLADGTNFISDTGLENLTYDNTFTLSMAVYPTTEVQNRGIFGRLEGNDVIDGIDGIRSRPTLLQFGRKLEFRMGDGAKLVTFRTLEDVLNIDQWNRVVVTFDGAILSIYVNGKLAGSSGDFAGMVNTLPNAGDVGRATPRARIRVNTIDILQQNILVNNVDIEFFYSQVTPNACSYGDGYDPDTTWNINVQWHFDNQTFYQIYDNFARDCVFVDGEDYYVGRRDYPWFATGTFSEELAGREVNFPNNRVRLRVNGEHLPIALPFVGRVDELAIYDYAFTPDRVTQSARADAAPLYLRLDDPTGSSGFVNVNGFGNAGCTGTACPLAGVPGRAGQAVQFAGDDLIVSRVPLNREAHSVSLWFKTDAPDGGLFAMADTPDGSGRNDAQLYLRGGQACAQLNGRELCAGSGLNDGRWHHVVHTATWGERSLYIDGVAEDAVGTSIAINPTHALIGAAPGAGVGGFTGVIDAVQVFSSALSRGAVSQVRNSVPALKLGFNEPAGSGAFSEDAVGYVPTCTAPQCPEQGIEARFGLAAGFDGVDDVVNVDSPFSVGTTYKQLTLEAWINSEQPKRRQFILHQNFGFQLGLTAEGKLYLSIGGKALASDLELQPNVWNHVAATYDGREMRLYLNGVSSESEKLAYADGLTPDVGTIHIGAFTPAGADAFRGRIEQVTIYTVGRPAFEVRDTFALESAWFEQRVRYPLTIDADPPTVNLRLDGDAPFFRNADARRVLIEAADVGSQVRGVEWSIDGANWYEAPACRDSAGNGTLWCPLFEPQKLRGANAEGRYTFQTRAFDLVDNQSAPNSVVFTVDATGPTATIAQAAGSTLPISADPRESKRYSLRLSGSVNDPNLRDGGPGSGVSEVLVSVFEQGTVLPIGLAPQQATLNSATWSLDYVYDAEQPNGPFTIEVIAVDAVGNRTRTTQTITLETTPPATTLSTANLSETAPIGPRTLSGTAADPGPPAAGVERVDIAFSEYGPGSLLYNEQLPAGALAAFNLDDMTDRDGVLTAFDLTGARRNGACIGATCPIGGVTAPTGTGMVFDGNDDQLRVPAFTSGGDLSVAAWVNPQRLNDTRPILARADGALTLAIVDGAYRFGPLSVAVSPSDLNGWAHLAGTVEGGVYRLFRNGVEVANAPAAAPPSANLAWTIGAAPGGFFAGSLDAVLIFGRPLTPAEINTLAAGSTPRLAITFERETIRDGNLLADGSGRRTLIRVQTGDDLIKTIAGSVDNFAMAFDGNDRVLAPFAAPGAAFSAGFRFRTADPQAGLIALTANPDGSGDYRGYYLRDGNVCVYLSAAETLCSSGRNYADDAWYHVAHTVGATGQRLYLNGALVGTGTGVGFDLPTSALLLGAAGIAPLTGALDDVRLYDRALSAAEIGAWAFAGWQAATLNGGNWSHVLPAGLEGHYQVNLRGIDRAGNIERRGVQPWAWRGLFDTLAPRVTIERTAAGGNYTYTVVASDYNLNPNNLGSPCGPATPLTITDRSYYEAPWQGAISGRPLGRSTQLIGLTATCTAPVAQSTGVAVVRDSVGNVRTLTFGAADLAGVPSLELLTDAATSAAGAPPVSNAAGNATLTVDRTVFTRNDYHPSGFIDLTGTVTDADGVAGLNFRATAPVQAAAPARLTAGNTWSLPWYVGVADLPDRVDYSTTFTVTNGLGELTTLNRTLTVDLRGPRILTPTISIAGTPFSPGMVVRTLNPQASVTMPAVTDGSGVDEVWYGWLPAADPDQAALTQAATAPATINQTLSNAPDPNGGAAWYFHLIVEDGVGNLSATRFGPVYYDPAPAPDYSSMAEIDGPLVGRPYSGWFDSSCTILGSDLRIEEHAPAGSALAQPQRFGLTWDATGLRMAWLGADWERDGDLYIYLDTGAGGGNTAIDPHTGATTVILPSGSGVGASPMAADYAIRLVDATTAAFYRWDGAAWQLEDSAAAGLAYRLDGAAATPIADLYLPFSAIGMAGPTGTVDVVAFAAVDAGPLRLWAAVPAANPLNSPLVVRNAPAEAEPSTLTLTDRYRVSLDTALPFSSGFGVATGDACRTPADQVRFSVAETAGGIVYDPFDVSMRLAAPDPSAPDLRDRLRTLFAGAPPPVAPSTTISYTVSYRNSTERTVNDVYALVESPDLTFSGCNLLSLGDLAPGAVGSKRISAISGPDDVGTATVTLYAAGQNGVTVNGCTLSGAQPGAELARFVVLYTEDNAAPVDVAITNLSELVPAGPVTIAGVVSDAAPVPTITLDVNGSATVCTDATPADGNWACAINLSGRGDGEVLNISASATDVFGQTSAPSPVVQTTVDAVAPPVVQLDPTLASTLTANVGLGGLPTLYGSIIDNRWAGPVLACDADNRCNPSAILLDPADPRNGDWQLILAQAEELDNVTLEYQLFGTDRVGNRVGEPIDLSFTVDNVPPVITSTLGISLTGVLEDVTELRGTISDGGGVGQMYVTVVAPADEIYQAEIRPAQGAWSYQLVHNNPGLHDVYVTGIDVSGNTHTLGPIAVDVQPLSTLIADLSVAIEPLPGAQVRVNEPYRYSITVTNNGPALATETILTTTLDPGITLLDVESSVGECADTTTPLLCNLGDLAVNATTTLTLTATIDAVGTYGAVAQVDSALLERIAADNTDRAEVVADLHRLNLPLIGGGPAPTQGPDLEVAAIRVENGQLRVTIGNTGNRPVTEAFWVDLYINPTRPPTEVNQTWEQRGTRGMVWGVTRVALPLEPGESLTLTLNDRYYAADRSNPGGDLAPGNMVYVQVDSVNIGTEVGGIRETHEIDGTAYDNIRAWRVPTAVTLPAAPPPATASISHARDMPRR